MSRAVIDPSTFTYLKRLSRNNNREWFNAHKEDYLKALEDMQLFVDALIVKMNRHDRIETPSGKKSLYRIYNDVRFAKNKSPYNPRFAGYLRRVKPLLRGGYYFWIKPGASRVGCGFTYPNSDDLKRIRKDIQFNDDTWRKILNKKTIRITFGEMLGEQVKTAPRGFAKDEPALDLLRYKQFWFQHEFRDNEVLSPQFLNQVDNTFKAVRPFFDHMSEILTTDTNGELIV